MTKRTVVKIGGMHCAGCVSAVQHYILGLDGVKSCEVNLASERATLEFDPAAVGMPAIEKAVEEAGYKVLYDRLSLKVANMTDSSDAQMLEKRLARMEGVKAASVNFGNGQVSVEYNPALISLADMKHSVSEAGFQVLGEDLSLSAEQVEAQRLMKLFLAGLAFTIPVIIFGHPEFSSWMPLSGTQFAAYLIFACAGIVQFLTGSRFYIGAYRAARMRSANMDTLVVTGTTAAYLFSAFHTFPIPDWNNIYYDASSAVVTFILLGKYLENKTKGRVTSVIRKMLELQPKTATLVRGGQEYEVPIESIMPDDQIIVMPGQKIPVDSIVMEGNSAVDQSAITGESIPVGKSPGDEVIGGTINMEGSLVLKASRVGKDTVLSQIVGLVEGAVGKKPPVQRLVDRVAGRFAFLVMSIALATFLGWYLLAPGQRLGDSLIPAVAILVVACPCALGLATPMAIMVGMGKSAQNGVIFKDGESLELLGKTSVAIFDKTGTLTEGKARVTNIIPVGPRADTDSSGESVLKLAATAERRSEHPLAKAVVAEAKARGIVVGAPDDFLAFPGRGVTASVDGEKVIVGNAALMHESGMDTNGVEVQASSLQDEGKTVMLVAHGGRISGIIALRDNPKKTVAATLGTLRAMGIKTVMLTGDNERTARSISRDLGIEHTIANVSPSAKAGAIIDYQKRGERVSMIGDGINDAAALTQADIGIAIGSGTDVAIEAGKVILLGGDLSGVIAAIEISRKTVGKIRQNLAYAFAYNAVLIPIAAAGLLYPALGGLAMAASSISVTVSSLLLRRWTPPSRAR